MTMLTEQSLKVGAYVMHHSAEHVLKVLSLNKTDEAVLSNGHLFPVSELQLVKVGDRFNVSQLESTFKVVGFDNWYTNKKEDALYLEQENKYSRLYRMNPVQSKCYPCKKDVQNAQ